MLRMRAYQDGDSFPGFSPEPGKGLYFIALDGERLVGYCRWRLLPGKIGIETVEDSGDPLVFDGLVRRVLSIASDQGIDRAAFSREIRPDRLATSQIPVNGENILISIEYFLENCKMCKKF